jgi:hypothetical protein
MKEPVMTRGGHIFEREAIVWWMEYHDQCPLTRNSISLKVVIANRALKVRIQAWKRAHQQEVHKEDESPPEEGMTTDEENYDDPAGYNDQYTPLLVIMESTKAMIQALEDRGNKKNDPTARYVLQKLKIQQKEELRQNELQRVAEAA